MVLSMRSDNLTHNPSPSNKYTCVYFFLLRCCFFHFSFLGGKVTLYFILYFGGVRDSSSAGQSLTFVSILEACISFEGGCEGVAVSKNHYLLLYISQIYFY